MQVISRSGHRITIAARSSCILTAHLSYNQQRAVSQKSAINRGLRSGLSALRERPLECAPTRSKKGQKDDNSVIGGRGGDKVWTRNDGYGRAADLGFSGKELRPKSTSSVSRRQQGEFTTQRSNGPKFPVRIHYTTAASEFLYGHSAVYAALRAGRRKVYTLYVHSRGKARDDLAKTENSILKMARTAGLTIHQDQDHGFLQLLDKMSEGRAHNGVVLEASPLPIIPLHALGRTSLATSALDIALASQSKEESAINGSPTTISYTNPQPVVLLLDDILDPGNVGAILRSAYFLGIDAVIMTTHCAPLNPQTLKSSSGAAEAIPLLRVGRPDLFLDLSIKEGWHVLCGTTPNPDAKGRRNLPPPLEIPSQRIRYWGDSVAGVPALHSRLHASPQIIIIGGEGRGLRPFLTQHANMFIEILPARDPELLGIDSLNVSVAASMICQDVLTRLREGEVIKKEEDDEGSS